MKKFLLSVALLMSVLPVCAVNWEMIDTDISNLNLYVDTDSIMYINNYECYYAIRYKQGDAPEKIAYLKSNSVNNYIGVIQTAEYGVDDYKPQVVFRNAHVFMKPVKENSFLSFAHEYSTTRQEIESLAQNAPAIREDNVKNVSYTLANNLKTYSAQAASFLDDNWNPPKSGRNTQAVIVLTIGIDGSLQNYKFTKSSGDEATDRSIISAVEKTVPFIKFPRNASDTQPAKFEFVFDYKLFKKTVL